MCLLADQRAAELKLLTRTWDTHPSTRISPPVLWTHIRSSSPRTPSVPLNNAPLRPHSRPAPAELRFCPLCYAFQRKMLLLRGCFHSPQSCFIEIATLLQMFLLKFLGRNEKQKNWWHAISMQNYTIYKMWIEQCRSFVFGRIWWEMFEITMSTKLHKVEK